MTRALLLLACAAGAVAWLLWSAARDLREPWLVPPMPDPDDGVQSDPYLVRQPIGGM